MILFILDFSKAQLEVHEFIVILLLQVLEKTLGKIGFANFAGELSSTLPGDEVLKVILLIQILEETSTMSLLSELTSTLPGDEVLKWDFTQVLEISWSSLNEVFNNSLDNSSSDISLEAQILEADHLKFSILVQVLEKPAGEVGLSSFTSEFSSTLPGDEVLEIILLL